MDQFLLSDFMAQAILSDMTTAVTGSLVTTTMMLTKTSVPNPNPALGMAQFTEAEFDGYDAAAGLVWSAPFKDTDGLWKVTAPSVLFQMTGDTNLDTIYAAVYTNAAKDEFRGVVTFRSAIALTEIGQGFSVVPQFVLPGQAAPVAVSA